MPHRKNPPLATHFLRRFVAVYVVLSVVGLAAMAVVEYQRQRARVLEEINALATTFGPVLGHAVWDYQDTAVTAIVHGIAQDPDVVEVRLPAAPGFASRREASPNGGEPSDFVRVEMPLTIPGDSGATQRVGTLVISSSKTILWRHVVADLAAMAATMGAILLLGAISLWVLVRRLLVDPLTRLSSQLQQETQLMAGVARRLPRFAGREFALLRLRFILLLRQVRRAQSELRRSHASLEARVDERTLALSQVLAQRERLEEELRQLAFHDALTLLPNRRLLLDRLDQAIRASKRHGSHLAVIFIDLNKFKLLNDTYGHDVGDKLLIVVAERLQAMVRGSDTVSRLGGDEFVVLSTDLGLDMAEATNNATLIADKIRASLAEPCVIDGVRHACSASVGLQIFSGDEHDAEAVLKQADTAMYEDKKASRANSAV